MAKNRAEIEAVAEPGREDPGIEIGIAHDADTAERGVVPSDGGIEPGLLDVGVERPALAERDVEAGLQREAPDRVDIDLGRAERIVARAGVEEIDVLHAGTYIRLELAHAGEVRLQRQSRRKDPGVGALAETGDGAPAVDVVLGEAAE